MEGRFRFFVSWFLVILLTGMFAPAVALAGGSVVNLEEAPEKIHEKSGAEVKFLATPEGQDTKAAFVAHLTVKAGGLVPEHRDSTEEYLYVLSGEGTIWIDDVKHEVCPGSLIYMPANAKAKFQAGGEDVKVLQVFAPPGPEKKYEGWKRVP